MRKAAILNFGENRVNIVDIPEEYIIYNIDGKMSAEDILDEMGYDLDHIEFMFFDGDIPVYKNDSNAVSLYL